MRKVRLGLIRYSMLQRIVWIYTGIHRTKMRMNPSYYS
jgi:hypothetical protein